MQMLSSPSSARCTINRTRRRHTRTLMVPTVDPRDWLRTLEMMEYYIRGFCVVDGQPLSCGLRDYFIAPVASSDPIYHYNEIKYFTHD